MIGRMMVVSPEQHVGAVNRFWVAPGAIQWSSPRPGRTLGEAGGDMMLED
jgi:hypothetical protein